MTINETYRRRRAEPSEPLADISAPPIPRNTPQAVQDCPILQWANGRTEARPVGVGRFAGFVGFHSEVGKDEAFDRVCHAAGAARMEIRHQRESGQPAIVQHWSFGEQIVLYPITAGPPATTISGCLRAAAATAEAGLGLAWPEGARSRLAIRALLLVGDTPVLIQLSARSTTTDRLLAALLDHYRACAAADSLIDRSKHPEPVMFHELAWPLAAGAEAQVGRGETTTITPFVSAHPRELDRDYITSCWRRKAVHEAALAAWPGIVVWAAGYRSGETNGDSHLAE